MGKKTRKNQKNETVSQISTEEVFKACSPEPSTNEKTFNMPSDASFASDSSKSFGSCPLRIHVNNIGFSTTDDDVEKFFAKYHPVKIKIVRGTGNSRCFCFVDFENNSDFMKALELDKALLNGRRLQIRIAERHVSRHYSENVHDDRSPIIRKLRETNSTEETGTFLPSPSVFPGRPRFVIVPRSMSTDVEELPQRNPSIFGEALPVDTASKDREIEEILLQRQKSVSSQPSEKGWKEQSSQPGKRLNMYKPKCGTIVSITSPGFNSNKPKAFFDSQSKTSPENSPKVSESTRSAVEPVIPPVEPGYNFWDLRKQERAKQEMQKNAKSNEPQQPEDSKQSKPAAKMNQTWANVAKATIPDAPPKTKSCEPEQHNKKKKTTENNSAQMNSVGASSDSSKIALAAVVSVAKLHQKKHHSLKNSQNFLNSFMPVINPYFGPYMSPMGIDYSVMPAGMNLPQLPPGMLNQFYMSGPGSDFGSFMYEPWSQPASTSGRNQGGGRGGKFARKNNNNNNNNAVENSRGRNGANASSVNVANIFSRMDASAKEFRPTLSAGGGMMIVRQMKSDKSEQPDDKASSPLSVVDVAEEKAPSVESWDDEVTSTSTDIQSSKLSISDPIVEPV